MKKNISINISGIIFHIEEDGYEKLRQYLDSINSYFGSFKDSSEILADIESRIAELFLGKLNDGKQIITVEDVQSLIATMGSVNDFKAAEEESSNQQQATNQAKEKTEYNRAENTQSAVHKRLFRDQKRKILGGIGAGLGHYFNIDPIWPRLLLALLVFGSYGGLIIIYIILWIVLPASEELVEDQPVKKMFRNSTNKVLGGVAGGVAAFFGADIVLIRVLFVISIFLGGLGLIVYLILWFSLPEAKTITEKMQMQGEPVTLSNIESSVKKSLNDEGQEESPLTKIVLFPFRVISAIISGIAKALTPVLKLCVDIIRIAIGLSITLTGVCILISVIIVFGIFLGIISTGSMPEGFAIFNNLNHVGLPIEAIRQSFPIWAVICAALVIIVPAQFIILIGNSIITKKMKIKQYVGWAMFAIFFLSVAFLAFTLPGIIYGFKEEAEFKTEKTFPISTKIQVLKLNRVALDDYRVTDIYLKGYEGTEIKLIERFEAQGSTKLAAKENAQMIDYTVAQNDSILTFDSNITFKKDAKFKFQRLKIDIFIPYDQPFEVDHELWEILTVNNMSYYNINLNRETQQWKFNKEQKLECLTCPAKSDKRDGIAENDEFGLKDFKEIELKGVFDVIIQRGDEFSIQIKGDEEQKKLYDINQYGDKLEINYRTRRSKFWNRTFAQKEFVTLEITMPTLDKVDVTGAGKISIKGFEENELHINLSGAMSGQANLLVDQLYYESNGPIAFELDGSGDYLEASLNGPSQLNAEDFKLTKAVVKAHGLGQVSVNPTESIEIEKDFTSNVKYKGNPEVIKRD